MTLLKEQLLQKEVIDENRIKKIRDRIDIRYETYTSKQKARILAQTIHSLIDHSLPNFSTDTKKSIRKELMQKKLSTNSLSISAKDIIESSVELATEEELEAELSQWVLKKLEIDANIVETHINNLLQRRKTIENEITYSPDPAIHPNIQIDEHKHTNDHTQKSILQKYKPFFIGAIASILAIFLIMVSLDYSNQKNNELTQGKKAEVTPKIKGAPNELPAYLQYENIDQKKLKGFLKGRNSLLAEEPYFSSIINVANEFNIHPLLLFAITGQEQAFVPKDQKSAKKIANNPFNVYHSWEDFNTNITESSQIAARTIVTLSKDRPKEADPIQWINRKYAEDKNWWVGVSSIFKQLKGVVK